MNPGKEWVIAQPHPQRERLARDARIAPLLAQLLLNRGVRSAAEASRFLSPNPSELLGPETLPNAVEAAQRLNQAVRDRRRIVIYGDYDVDGVTATTILWHILRLADADVRYYLPSRLEEGYGLNCDALQALRADGAEVVITVDCGVAAIRQAATAREIGLELIITDHHEPGPSLPDALVVHPTAVRPDSPNPHLSGAGVALKLAWAFAREFTRSERVPDPFRECLREAMALAALGLVADVAPLTGENRSLASFGLHQLCKTNNAGLRALIEVSGLTGKAKYDDYDVGFMLAPRLNAVGRMGHAREAVELFTTAGPDRARDIAQGLDAHNRQRQSVEREIFEHAERRVLESGQNRDCCRAIVLADDGWHPGVIGIVASRLVERFHRPTVLIALSGEAGQGSGRSIRHFPLHEALAACADHLISSGGHAMAAGLRVRRDRIDAFADAFQAEAAQRLTQRDLLPKLMLDDEVRLSELLPESVEAMHRLGPFGAGNPRPRLATAEVELSAPPRVVGKGNHIQLFVRENGGASGAGGIRKAIAFNAGRFAPEFNDHQRMRLAFEPILNEWNGRRSVELRVLDWKWCDA